MYYEPTTSSSKIHWLGFPEVFSLFTAGTWTKNIGFFRTGIQSRRRRDGNRTGVTHLQQPWRRERREHPRRETRPFGSLLIYHTPATSRIYLGEHECLHRCRAARRRNWKHAGASARIDKAAPLMTQLIEAHRAACLVMPTELRPHKTT